ncbi:hypothetical protein [Intestinibacter sp.]
MSELTIPFIVIPNVKLVTALEVALLTDRLLIILQDEDPAVLVVPPTVIE